MPAVESTITFTKKGDNEFCGFLSEGLLVLPKNFGNPIEVKGQKLLTAWGSVCGNVREGEFLDRNIPKLGQDIRFIKSPDQLSGCPVHCRAGFNAFVGSIRGRWAIIEGGSRCYLPLNLKMGYFVLSKIDNGGRVSTESTSPVTPELLPA